MKMRWTYNFDRASQNTAVPPGRVAPGQFPLLIGMDGRFDGIFRRYLGHTRPTDTWSHADWLSGTTNRDSAYTTELSPDYVRPFEVQKGRNTNSTLRGLVVGQASDGRTEIWWKDGTLKRQSLRAPYGKLGRVDITPGAGVTQPGTAGDLRDGGDLVWRAENGTNYALGIDKGSVLTTAVHNDGSGEKFYVGGSIRRAGGRNCWGVARYDGHKWEPVGSGLFGQVYKLLSVTYLSKSYLFAGGDFRLSGGRVCRGLAVWTGTGDWQEVGGGVGPNVTNTPATVYDLCQYTDTDPATDVEYLAVVGDFGYVDLRVTTTTNASCSFALFKLDQLVTPTIPTGGTTTTAWVTFDTAGSRFAVSAGVYPVVYAVSCVNTTTPQYLMLGGKFGTADGSAVNEGLAPTCGGTAPGTAEGKRCVLVDPNPTGSSVWYDVHGRAGQMFFDGASSGWPHCLMWAKSLEDDANYYMYVGRTTANLGAPPPHARTESVIRWSGSLPTTAPGVAHWLTSKLGTSSSPAYSAVYSLTPYLKADSSYTQEVWVTGVFNQWSAGSLACFSALRITNSYSGGVSTLTWEDLLTTSAVVGIGNYLTPYTSWNGTSYYDAGDTTYLGIPDIRTAGRWNWDGFVGLGENATFIESHINSLTLFPQPTDSDYQTAPSSGWDVAVRGRFLYLLHQGGIHRVLRYDETTSLWVQDEFGPLLEGIEPPYGVDLATDSDFYGIGSGFIQAAYRYRDPLRNRYTQLSWNSPNIEATAGDGTFTRVAISPRNPSAAGLIITGDPPFGFSEVEVYRTMAATATAMGVSGGGTLYRDYRGSVNWSEILTTATAPYYGRTGKWLVHVGDSAYSDDGHGFGQSNLSDLALAGLPDSFVFDPLYEALAELRPCYAVAHLQDVTFVAEEQDSFVSIRWSNTYRLEPEGFPIFNAFPTKIPVADATSCKFVQAGDFLMLTGGGFLYRIQKIGQRVSVVELSDSLPVVGREAITAIGPQLYAMTRTGVVGIDSASGQILPLEPAAQIPLTRWSSSLTGTAPIWAAYDSVMECLYFHHSTLHESLQIWWSTKKISMLSGFPVSACVAVPGLDGGQKRAYFLSSLHWLCEPNPRDAGSTAHTITGISWIGTPSYPRFNMTTTGSHCTVSTLASGGLSGAVGGNVPTTVTTTYPGPYTKIVFTGTPFGTSTSNHRILAPFYVRILYGLTDYIFRRVVWNDHNTLYIDESDSSKFTDKVLSLDPILTIVVGSPLWGTTGPDPWSRKLMTGQSVLVDDYAYPNADGQTSPAGSTWGVFRVGAVRQDGILDYLPRGSATGSPFLPHQVDNWQEGSLPDLDKQSRNWQSIRTDGTQLFPFLWCEVANWDFDLQEWTISGDLETSEISGPGTT